MMELIKEKWKILLAAVLVICAALGAYAWHADKQAKAEASTLTLMGNVDVRQVDLAFKISDRIDSILVSEGDAVKKGDVLAKLDEEDLNYQIYGTKAQIKEQEAVVEKLHNGSRPEEIASAAAKAKAAEAQRDFLQRDYDRKAEAYSSSGGKSVSKQVLDDAASKLAIAISRADEAREANNLVLAGPRKEDVAAGEAQLDVLKQTLARQEYVRSQAELISPVDGVIRSKLMEEGDLASPQKPVFLISLLDKKWVRVYVSETDLGHVHEGQEAKVYIDSYPDKAIAGQVGYISSTAEFTPKTVETKDLRTALLYEVRVYVDDPDNLLRMGMPATVKISK